MNYSALSMGTWYPMGGMLKIAEGMESLAKDMGVVFETACEVKKIDIQNGKVRRLDTGRGTIRTEGAIAASDYHHTEQSLMDEVYRNYEEEYWGKRTMAPSCLIFYIGVGRKVKGLIHHNLFFDTSMDVHSREIYEHPQWPSDPLFYVCCPSKTDASVAPEGMENLFVLIPVSPGLEDTPAIRQHYFDVVMRRMSDLCGDDIREDIVYNKSYCIQDFKADYNAYRGNAYGLANTLRQTAVLKPSLRNKKVSNLFYAGQLTVPGPGVPPALISGQIAAEQLLKTLKKQPAR
jgi:phytoene desaturase